MSIPNLELFTIHVPIELSRVAFTKKILPEDGRTDSVQEERLGLPWWTMIIAMCFLLEVSKYLDILTSEFSTMMVHLPFWPGCKLVLRLLLVLSQCHLGVQLDLLYFWNCDSKSEFLRGQTSINDAKCTVLQSFLASAITSFWFQTFVSCHSGIFSSSSHSLSTAVFASGIFIAWGTGINLRTKL